ncbi:hypothetical protein [Novosphingobium kunmingense]|nr:hypothetical protein [Novosphingobium kunmingense]
MSRESAYALRRRADARGFAQAWDAARLLAAEHLVDLAWDRAVEGELRPLVWHGEVVGEVRHYDNRLLLGLIAQNRKVLVEQGLVAPPEVTAAVALDWEAALERAERGEALEADALGQDQGERALGPAQDEREQEDVPPPLPEERDLDGEVMDEAQQLEVGLYRFHHAPDGESLLTNWPASEGFCGQWYRVASDEAEAEPIARDPADPAMADDGEEWPGLEEAFRALLPAEAEGIARMDAARAAAQAARLALYARSACGLTTAAEEASLRAANPGGCWPR